MDSMIDIEKIRPDLRYSVLRNSLSRYETPPFQLSSDKLTTVIKQAEKEFEIQKKILSSKEAMGIVLPDESIARALKEVSSRYPNEEEFYDDLSRNKLDEEQLRESLFRELKVETVLERITSSSAKVSDLDVMIYYHMHQQKMKKPEVRKASHILITVNEDLEENSRYQSSIKINEIVEKLKKKPKRFAELALKYSECPTAYKGGELGSITKGTLYPELEEVLFSLQETQISPAVESPLGFHILRCEEIQYAKTISVQEATPAIRILLEERRKKICQKTWLSKLIAGDNNG